MRTVFAVAVVAGLAWVALPSRADAPPRSLGEVAAKDKDKKKTGKVYTEDDLRNNPRGTGSYSQPAADGSTPASTASPSPAAGGSPVPGAAPTEKPKTEDELRADREKDWREKLTQAQADVATWTGEVSRLQTSLADTGSGPLYGPGRAARAQQLENAKTQLTAATQAVENLQEEGRRNRFR